MYSEYDTFNNNTVEHFMWDWFKGSKGDKGDKGDQGDPAADIRFGNLDNLTLKFNKTMTPWNKLDIKPTSLYGDNVTDPSKNDISGNKYITMSNMMFQNPYIVPKDYGQDATIRYGKAGGVESGTWWESGVKKDGNFQIFKENNYDTGIILKKSGGVDICGNLNINNDLFIKGIKANNIIELSIESNQLSIVANKFIFDINLNNILGLSNAPIKTRVINLYAYNTIAPSTQVMVTEATVLPAPLPAAQAGSQVFAGFVPTIPENTSIYTGIYNIIYNNNINLQRITKINESIGNQVSSTSITFNIKPLPTPNPSGLIFDYNIIRYESTNNRPVTIIFEILS